MSVYKITLVPLERFFFGSDNTFGKKNQENYFVKSMHFPQQTTLLGTLRYLLLKHFGLMDADGKVSNLDAEEKLIGCSGFSVIKGHNKYGIINNISPLFITGPKGDYVVNSREYGLDWVVDEFSREKKQDLIPLYYKLQNGSSKLHSLKSHIPFLSGITSKTVIPELLLCVRSGEIKHLNYNPLLELDPQNGIFIEEQQVGINKKEPDNALFKQIGYRLADGYGFSFYSELKDEDEFKIGNLQTTPIKMGTDNSWFMASMQLVENYDNVTDIYKNPLKELFKYPNSLSSKIVLLSDTYIEKELFKRINFAVSDIYPFRFMTTFSKSIALDPSIDVYHNVKGGYKTSKGMTSYELLKRGSVLFVNHSDKEELINLISGNNPKITEEDQVNKSIYSSFNQIGYNYAI
ncbi:MAG: type III-B CRISPR module-associated Cmr3 family protein [Bacteroidales bacterium]|nr:type III-B CRISPR module-associated Cmr3 family protein [Bacteroidales bacterium]